MGSEVFGPLLVIVILIVGVALTVLRFSRASSMLRDWAASNGYEIVNQEYCWFWPGPFLLRKSKGQMVYRIEVRDQHGNARSGYARLGGWFLGMLSDQVEVHWDT